MYLNLYSFRVIGTMVLLAVGFFSTKLTAVGAYINMYYIYSFPTALLVVFLFKAMARPNQTTSMSY